ncbi:DNA helicase/exodeoxyribonuclease V, gamma subunit [Acinetobacter marinus]|uniref:RecBCD enzyme subunit RecC n=1 Tax=Acinetobacter marinus TaxID=281375 RepID=A0A1G6HFI3_9GAMM|nr:exodeoxyribonuclease V subunit gamma [Acinetobacter marinus]SDB92695.1 DNA helicase/exodeoxyribonuclease V, gamma subunit [Acinetobacter marinus]
MGIDILQSQRPEVLLHALMQDAFQPKNSAQSLLQSTQIVVPNHGIGQWLQQQLAEQQGISANIEFSQLRTLQWQLYQAVLGQEPILKAPQMLNMKWRIYLFLNTYFSKDIAEKSITENHALYGLFQRVRQHSDAIENALQRSLKQQNLLYWIADQTSRLFANYIVYRGQCVQNCEQLYGLSKSGAVQCRCRQNWLHRWGNDQEILVQKWLRNPEKVAQKDSVKSQPEAVNYQIQQAQQLEQWQRFIWHEEFAADFQQIESIDQAFWQTLTGEFAEQAIRRLPPQIYIFTLLELPPSQLNFLRRLAQYTQIKIYHYAPSQEYWADSVDPYWKAKYELKYPDAAVYYESRHPLLTRLGKQARDIGALLSQLAGGEEGDWQDHFVEIEPQHLLSKIQSDILHLSEPVADSYALADDDRSIQIHVCHSTMRQLEVLKDQLTQWLSADTAQKRQPSDIVVLVPNLSEIETQIRTVFHSTHHANLSVNSAIKNDILTAAPMLPVKIAGVPIQDALQLWQSITLRFKLLHQRFSLEYFADWLSLPATLQRFALTFEQVQRMLELLESAGFKRGFDQAHLAQSLAPHDQDFRFSFRYALDRLALAIAMPEHALFDEILSLESVQTADFELIGKLIEIHHDLDSHRDWLTPQAIDQQQTLAESVALLDTDISDFEVCTGWRYVQDALHQFKRIIEVTDSQAVRLPLSFVLDEIESTLSHKVSQTEPTGYITFAQIGQLRPLPYQLVVCLNMDTGTFPNRDAHIPFDLMELLQAELGDRSRLEDDQGAFLDALLQAQDQFWLFYNGFDVQDAEVRDPSSIVQELVQHLDLIVAKSSDQHREQKPCIEESGLVIPRHLSSIYNVHPLQPFDPKGFTDVKVQRYRSQWWQVAQQIQQPSDMQFFWLDQSPIETSTALQIMDVSQWIKDLSHPAQHFLRHAGIANVGSVDAFESFEPLQLGGLQKYSVRDYLQQCFLENNTLESDAVLATESTDLLLLQDKMPIGKMQNATWQQAQSELDQVLERLSDFGGKVTLLTTKTMPLGEQLQLNIQIPSDESATNWVSLTASSCHGARALSIWLQYLLWRAYADQIESLTRIALFKNMTLIFSELSQENAQKYLQDWLEVWTLQQNQAFALPPAIFAQVGDKQLQFEIDDQGEEYVANFKEIEKRWLGQHYYHADFENAYSDQGSSLSPDWALVIAPDEAAKLLNQHSEKYAVRLYQPMFKHLQKPIKA